MLDDNAKLLTNTLFDVARHAPQSITELTFEFSFDTTTEGVRLLLDHFRWDALNEALRRLDYLSSLTLILDSKYKKLPTSAQASRIRDLLPNVNRTLIKFA